MLHVDGLHKHFSDHAVLRGASLHVAPGEMVVLMGPSGSGKTTLFRCIGRLVEPDSGDITLAGTDIRALRGRRLRAARRDVAVIFQQFNLIRRASVLANVLSGKLGTLPAWRVCIGRYPQAEVAHAVACLSRVGLADFAKRRADTLSGGQQQRVAIARALAQRSCVILADEPVASLDTDNARLVLDLLRELAREDGIAVLCSLHDRALAERYADRILVLHEGRIVGRATAVPDGMHATARTARA